VSQRKEYCDATSKGERVKCVAFKETINLNVAEHEVLEIRVALKWDACLPPHRTVSSVAPGEVAGSNLLLLTTRKAKEATHAVRLRHGLEQLDAALDHHPIRGEVIAKHGFGFGLRDEQNKWEASIGLAEVA
jgi:hypothetical protein